MPTLILNYPVANLLKCMEVYIKDVKVAVSQRRFIRYYWIYHTRRSLNLASIRDQDGKVKCFEPLHFFAMKYAMKIIYFINFLFKQY